MVNTRRRTHVALLAVTVSLCMAALACWSSDTLFIPPTPAPTPTTPPPTPDFESLYHIGDTLVIKSVGIAPVYLTQRPEPVTRRNRVPNAACYAGSTVVVQGIQQVDGVTYYEVACNNRPGWLDESQLGLP